MKNRIQELEHNLSSKIDIEIQKTMHESIKEMKEVIFTKMTKTFLQI